MRAVFLLSKAPYGQHQDGETQISRLLLESAALSCDVSGLALAESASRPGPIPVQEIPKSRLRLLPTALAATARRRSMIHARFTPPTFVEAVAGLRAVVLVARRLYMAQAALDATHLTERGDLVTLADVLESEVLRQRRSAASPLLRLEARRTWRDEVRCARASARVACFSDTERGRLSPELAEPPERVDLVLPPAERPSRLSDPVAVFVGDLHWPPNREAALRLIGLWPAIRAACSTARLVMVGRGTDGLPSNDGIEHLGFVKDINRVWERAGILVAPVVVGGGVRVKILDAVRRGVPVVATDAAVGSVNDYLPVRAAGSDGELVDRAAELLRSGTSRRQAGEQLFEANRELSQRGFVERQLEQLLAPWKRRRA